MANVQIVRLDQLEIWKLYKIKSINLVTSPMGNLIKVHIENKQGMTFSTILPRKFREDDVEPIAQSINDNECPYFMYGGKIAGGMINNAYVMDKSPELDLIYDTQG